MVDNVEGSGVLESSACVFILSCMHLVDMNLIGLFRLRDRVFHALLELSFENELHDNLTSADLRLHNRIGFGLVLALLGWRSAQVIAACVQQLVRYVQLLSSGALRQLEILCANDVPLSLLSEFVKGSAASTLLQSSISEHQNLALELISLLSSHALSPTELQHLIRVIFSLFVAVHDSFLYNFQCRGLDSERLWGLLRDLALSSSASMSLFEFDSKDVGYASVECADMQGVTALLAPHGFCVSFWFNIRSLANKQQVRHAHIETQHTSSCLMAFAAFLVRAGRAGAGRAGEHMFVGRRFVASLFYSRQIRPI